MDRIGTGERETAKHIDELVTLMKIALGYGTIAIDSYVYIIEMYLLETCLLYSGIYLTYRQLSTLNLTHLSRAGLREIEVETSR